MRTSQTLLACALGLALAAPFASYAKDKASKGEAKDEYAVFETSRGKIAVRLLPAKAPNAVANFIGLATGKKSWTDPVTGKPMSEPLYDGTLFHRVIPGFMVQGGDPLSRGAPLGQSAASNGRPFGTGDPGYKFPDELEQPGATPFQEPCQLAMANSGPDTNGSQFFITEVSTAHLNPRACSQARSGTCGYVHFGEGVCGCNLVSEIARAGNDQTKLVKITITKKVPTCK